MNWGLAPYLTVGAALAALGCFALMTRRDLRGLLLGILLLLGGACLDFAASARLLTGDLVGHVAVLVIVLLGVAQVIVLTALARGVDIEDDGDHRPGDAP